MKENVPRTLEMELADRIRLDERRGRWNYFFAQLFVCVAISSSIAGAVLAAWPDFPRKAALVVLFTSLSAVSATVERSLKFERRAAWHYLLAAKLKGLLRALYYEDASRFDISKSFSATIEAFEGEWPSVSPPEEKERKKRADEQKDAPLAQDTLSSG